MPSNLKRFTKELKEKTALFRKLAASNRTAQQAEKGGGSARDFPITMRAKIYGLLPIHRLVNEISKLSIYDRNLLLKSFLLKDIKKNTHTLIVEKTTCPRGLNKLRFQFLLADNIKLVI